jgi:hypothetical protein
MLVHPVRHLVRDPRASCGIVDRGSSPLRSSPLTTWARFDENERNSAWPTTHAGIGSRSSAALCAKRWYGIHESLAAA